MMGPPNSIRLLIATLVASPAFGSALFEGDSVLEVTLSGPLSTVIEQQQDREEHPFAFSVDDLSVDVAVRIRGNSRVVVCPFPPLRLNFVRSDLDGTFLEGEDTLKLVTHCRNGSEKAQESVLNEFAAYRIFNLISDRSYRVRLLRIQYEDSDGKQSKLDRPHYGFLIESAESLTKRLEGAEAQVKAIRFSALDAQQTARLSVFQYLIGNTDWSFVMSRDDDVCCHNVDLIRVNGELVPIPFDFDLAALTRARYRSDVILEQSRRREYRGYCRSSDESTARAVDHIQQMRDRILAVVNQVPALEERTRKRRVAFASAYFEEADDRARLLARFRRTCIGSG